MASDNKLQLSGIISLIFSGLASVLVLLFFYTYCPLPGLIPSLFAIIGIVFGAIGVVKARKIHRKLALAGLILGVLCCAALFILLLAIMAAL